VFGIKSRYLASVFLDADELVPSGDMWKELIDVLQDEQMQPNTVQEPTPLGKKTRISFKNSDGSIILVLTGQRFDFMRRIVSEETMDLGDFTAFCTEASSKLSKLTTFLKKESSRLAAVQEGFLQQMTDEEMSEVATRLFKFPKFYVESLPFEWDWRLASSVRRTIAEFDDEQTNNITSLRRATGHLVLFPNGGEIKQINGIRLDLDINTTALNDKPRFVHKHIESFFSKVVEWHDELGNEIFSLIKGEAVANQ